MKTIGVLLAVALVVEGLAAPGHQARYGRLVVFGDSLSDNGNGAWVYSNNTWPQDPAYYNHSFSNGPKWNDVLAKRLDMVNVNLAVGGSTTDNDFVEGGTGASSTIPVPDVKTQIERFISQNTVQANDVFVHWSGANDAMFNPNISGEQYTEVVAKNIKTLFQAGARTILLPTYPLLDTFPANFNGDVDYSPFDDTYKAGLQSLIASYSISITMALVDVGALFSDISAHPTAYPFDPSVVNPPTPCLKGVYTSEGVPRSLCENPEDYEWFDSYHPTARTHELIAGLFEKALVGLSGCKHAGV